MTLETLSGARLVVAGAAEPVRAALAAFPGWAPRDARIAGVALVGPGEIDGVEVLARAPAWDALTLMRANSADALVLAEASPSRVAARALLEHAAEARLKVMLLDGAKLRSMRIDDVIGRTLADFDWAAIRSLIAGRRVLITGGGGSIGGELARRVASLAPARLTLLDSSEYNLFKAGQELPQAKLALADVRDTASMQRWFQRERPELVFHAAALKHVPMVEAHPSEGLLTNVWGCRNVAEAAQGVGADMVFVSTDKAVNPTGVMGATKRLAEMYCQALDRESVRRGGKRVLIVRLGNVLGSAGSVTPMFESQLVAGGPLTITDPQVSRYFTTIPQAADFMLQVAALGVGCAIAPGAAFVLDMGEPMPVVDLARKMIRLNGQRPEDDVAITYVGMRPGEKLHEQLIAQDEWRETDPAIGVMAVASPAQGLAVLNEAIGRLALLARAGEDAAVVTQLHLAAAPAQPDALDLAPDAAEARQQTG